LIISRWFGRIDLGGAAVMALEAQPVRRDDAVEFMQRREVDRGYRIRGQPLDVAADHMGLEFGRFAVGRSIDAFAEIAVPVLDFCDQRIACGTSRTGAEPATAPRRQAARP
jgi:hypothetical protein